MAKVLTSLVFSSHSDEDTLSVQCAVFLFFFLFFLNEGVEIKGDDF